MEKSKLAEAEALNKKINDKQKQVEKTKQAIEKLEENIKNDEEKMHPTIYYSVGHANGIWVDGIEPEMALLFNTIILSKREIELRKLEKEFEKL